MTDGLRGYRADRAFDGGRARPEGVLVLVADGRIVGVEPGSAPAPDGCEVRYRPGTTLLPGLIDAHVHLCGDSGPRALDQLPELDSADLDGVIAAALRAQLSAGVTAVRDLGDRGFAVLDRRGGAGPTVVASGPPITSVQGHCWGMGGEASTVDGLRRAVRERAERGVDIVKIMASGGAMTPGSDVLACQFSLEELRAAVDEAHRLGLPITAHAHALPAVEQAVEAGVDGIEHCSCIVQGGFHAPPELVGRIASAGIPVCPTLGTLPGAQPPPRVLAMMQRTGMTFEGRRVQVAGLFRGGVTLVSGADAGINPGKPHGVLPEAVAELADCGVPAATALASATSLAARACGLAGRTGRLAVGLDADLVLVDGDPLLDLTALRAVRTVVSRGQELARTTD
jgi:imidazolonepropionase-like amidohydrolase